MMFEFIILTFVPIDKITLVVLIYNIVLVVTLLYHNAIMELKDITVELSLFDKAKLANLSTTFRINKRIAIYS